MRLVARTLGGCVALVCAASLSGGTAVPVIERAMTPAPGGADLASLGGPSDVPPELQSPSADVRVSVTEVETEVDVEIVDTTGSVIDESGYSAGQTIAAGATGIPSMVLAAYRAAAEQLAREDPSCGLRWQVLAGIGKIESSHARGGQLNATGVNVPRIIGPVLNGGPGVAAISDSDGGEWDGDPVWDRAVGPMQFIPGTWRGFGADADGDGASDPHNVWDATLAAARYLCAGDADLRTTGGLRSALYRYNHSDSYVNHVLSWINAYLDGEPTPTPDRGPGDAVPPDNASREPEKPNVPKPDDDKKKGGKGDDDKDQKPEGPPDGEDPEPVEVPELVGMALAEAKTALDDLGLAVKVVEQEVQVEAQVGKVLSQTPKALAEVEPGSEVTLTVGVAPPVEVPDLGGMTLAEAEAKLAKLGLVVAVEAQVVADPAQVDQVLDQDPAASTEVEPGSVVTLTVGVPPVVPELVGMARADAEAALTDLGLVAVVVEKVVEDESRIGEVLEQSPAASTEVEPGSEVTLTVGVAPPPGMPDVLGETRAEAEATLTDLGLVVVVVEKVVEDGSLVDRVLAQDPEAATEVEPGAEVTLTVGAAP